MDDLISRQAALDCVTYDEEYTTECIKALPSLQPTCNQLATDVISRKAALDGIADYLEEYDGVDENGNHDLKWCAMKEAELLIKDLPSAQPERKKGRWLPDNIPGGGFWVCSCCKFPSEAFAADVLYKFCPNCGADMRKARWNG